MRLMLMITGPREKKNEGVGSVTKGPMARHDVAVNMLAFGALEPRVPPVIERHGRSLYGIFAPVAGNSWGPPGHPDGAARR